MKRVSVIIPCYNAEKFIMKCFEQLNNQSLDISEMEIIFVNDGSSDNTRKLIEELIFQHPDDVFMIDLKNNKGASNARNCGLKAATSSYVAFVDCDDTYDSSMLSKMVEAAEEHLCDIVECDLKMVTRDEDAVASSSGISQYLDFSDTGVKAKYIMTFSHQVCGKLFRTSFLRREKLSFNTDIVYGEDAVFSGTAIMLANGIYSLKERLYFYHINNNGSVINSKSILYRIDEMASLKERLIEEYRRRGIYDEVMDKYGEQFQGAMMICCYFNEMPEIYSEIYRLRDNIKEIFPNITENKYLQILDDRHKKYMSFFDN